ncbi:hypothetical protein HK101_002609, partial [Irineochytrium annulatum]
MVLIGLGFYGTSSSNSLFDTPPVDIQNATRSESSLSVTADALWDIINPSKSDRYVEIRPPIYITLVRPGDPLPVHLTDPEPVDRDSGGGVPGRTHNWEIHIDTFTLKLSPAMFTSLVVLFLLLFTLSCVFVTSLLYSVTKPARLKKSSSSSDLSSGLISAAPWGESEPRVLSVPGSESSDVSALATSEAGTVAWTCGDGVLRMWNVATSRRTTIREAMLKVDGRSAITCLELAGYDDFVAAGTLTGGVVIKHAEIASDVAAAGLARGSGASPVVAFKFSRKAPRTLYALHADARVRELSIESPGEVEHDVTDFARHSCCRPDQLEATALEDCGHGRLAVGFSDGAVLCWGSAPPPPPSSQLSPVDPRAYSSIIPLVGHTSAITCLSALPELGLLASATSAGDIILWDLTTMREILYFGAVPTGDDD